ncbi:MULTISPECIES: restriction endonuclease fold toxin [Streptomyces]|uniref:restriction endonuclease fold toxin n=1 Tax=Streptomyces TaxID=1883 RepID=UPI0023B955EA|nr:MULTISPECIES: restriction endonuclease fold toxin [unclassified Streptomyces]MDT0423546.1 restriction endonuclease fold toxin [Streptomyces sp. DSM 41859]WEH28918.1 restriction endonuclease fold toxin [Streptomyces sp. AM 3-1-1]
MTASAQVRDLAARGKTREAADVHYEDMVRARTGGTSQMINGREVDVVTSDALIQVKRTMTAVNRPKNFLSKSTRNQIKATLSSADEMGVRAEFWFKYGVHRDVRSYIEGKGGIVVTGFGD